MESSEKLSDIIAERVSPSLIAVSAAAFNDLGTNPVLDGQAFAYYRRGKDEQNQELAFYRLAEVPPASFLPEDNETLNSYCETDEGKKNKAVKREISASLSAHFNKQSFHVYEFGAGNFPISNYFRQQANLSYHGIDTDRTCITELHRMGYSASGWDIAMQVPPPEDMPAVAVSVYAMHFMVDQDFADRVKHMTSVSDGFFVGNFYVDPAEKLSRTARTAMENILFENGLCHIALKHPKENSNEYWVVGRLENAEAMHSFVDTMQKTVAKNWGRPLDVAHQSSRL